MSAIAGPGLTLDRCSVTENLVMDLLVVQLKAAIRRLLEEKGVRARVLEKVNRYGEVVIGVILDRPPAAIVPDRDDPSGEERNGRR